MKQRQKIWATVLDRAGLGMHNLCSYTHRAQAQKGPMIDLTLNCCHLEILNTFVFKWVL